MDSKKFYADFQMGLFTFATISYKKTEPKYCFRKKLQVPKNRVF
jgi:hypothetical protein